MRYPQFENKHDQESLIEPHQYLDYLKSVGKMPSRPTPKGVILCYQGSLLKHIRENHKAVGAGGGFGSLYYLEETGSEIAVTGGFGIGSPVAAVILEELVALGVKEFISIGTAGTLQKHIDIGDLVLCDRAIRDEGTSHHYLPVEKYVQPSARLTARLAESLRAQGKIFHTGTTWTIDAPYRETIAEARHYQAEGVLTVEMEAAALFAVAKVRGVEIASLLTISDSLADLKWKPEFHSARTKAGLEAIYQAALAAF